MDKRKKYTERFLLLLNKLKRQFVYWMYCVIYWIRPKKYIPLSEALNILYKHTNVYDIFMKYTFGYSPACITKENYTLYQLRDQHVVSSQDIKCYEPKLRLYYKSKKGKYLKRMVIDVWFDSLLEDQLHVDKYLLLRQIKHRRALGLDK